jgi:hypothetical protein
VHGRAIVYPQGLPLRPEATAHCAELMLTLGGDPRRLFEPGNTPFASFVRYLARVPAFRRGEVKALVVATRLAPLESVVSMHHSLVRHVPALARSMWLMFWDHETLVDLPQALVECGRVTGAMSAAPIWQAHTGPRFMVLSTRTTPEALREWLDAPRQDARAASGIRSRADRAPKSRLG